MQCTYYVFLRLWRGFIVNGRSLGRLPADRGRASQLPGCLATLQRGAGGCAGPETGRCAHGQAERTPEDPGSPPSQSAGLPGHHSRVGTAQRGCFWSERQESRTDADAGTTHPRRKPQAGRGTSATPERATGVIPRGGFATSRRAGLTEGANVGKLAQGLPAGARRRVRE